MADAKPFDWLNPFASVDLGIGDWCRVALKKGHPQFVWRHYPETRQIRRGSRDFQEALGPRKRGVRPARWPNRRRGMGCVGHTGTKRHLPGLRIAFGPKTWMEASSGRGFPRTGPGCLGRTEGMSMALLKFEMWPEYLF